VDGAHGRVHRLRQRPLTETEAALTETEAALIEAEAALIEAASEGGHAQRIAKVAANAGIFETAPPRFRSRLGAPTASSTAATSLKGS
jgi:hypothetical protein